MLFPANYRHHKYDFVFVFKDREGVKRVIYTASHAGDLLSDERNTYTIFGIFPNLAQDRQRYRPFRHNGEFSYLGVPEGASLYPAGNEIKVNYHGTNIPPARQEFQYRMQSILDKAKELQEMGIDKKTALAAARKCDCKRIVRRKRR